MNDDTNPDQELRVLIQKVARRIRNERSDESITDSQLGVLLRLADDGRCTLGSLAEKERVSAPAMNRTVNALEAAGFVRRDPSDEDARRVWVTITPAGETLLAETRALRTQWFHDRLDELTEEERAALEAARPVLRKLADS